MLVCDKKIRGTFVALFLETLWFQLWILRYGDLMGCLILEFGVIASASTFLFCKVCGSSVVTLLNQMPIFELYMTLERHV